MPQTMEDDPKSTPVPSPDPPRYVPYRGKGWLMLGVLWASTRAFERIAGGTGGLPGLAAVIFEALAIAATFVLAGRALAIAWSRLEASILARRERESRSDRAVDALASRLAMALERLVDVLEHRPVAMVPGGTSAPDRERLLAEIGTGLRSGRWSEVGALLEGFESQFPGDHAVAGLRERLEAARREEHRNNLEKLEAARRVNDPDRVLELYRAVESSLEFDRRGELGRELARWFLELIHRRLRNVPIQAEVVHLATQVSDVFGATTEGASLRASLPMLRRTVGLCPRCAEPYKGTAAACPRCLGGPTGGPVTGPTPTESGEEPEEEADDAAFRPGRAPDGDRDDGWMRYDEDDRDDLDPPA